jgi:hypothetical protein
MNKVHIQRIQINDFMCDDRILSPFFGQGRRKNIGIKVNKNT